MTRPAPETAPGSCKRPSRMIGQPLTNDHWMRARACDVARPAVRHVVDDLLLVAGDGARVEYGDVRRESGGEAPAVGNAEDLRRGSRDEAYRGLERQGLSLAHPVAEELARLARCASAPGVAGVRVWQVMSRGRDPRARGARRRRAFMLPILAVNAI